MNDRDEWHASATVAMELAERLQGDARDEWLKVALYLKMLAFEQEGLLEIFEDRRSHWLN